MTLQELSICILILNLSFLFYVIIDYWYEKSMMDKIKALCESVEKYADSATEMVTNQNSTIYRLRKEVYEIHDKLIHNNFIISKVRNALNENN